MSENRMEIIWGVRLLDEGFTSVPNLIIRNYRKLGIEHGEFGFICQLLTYKHDTRDPYPSRATLAEHMCCSERQIDKWVGSLVNKDLLETGQRVNRTNKQWDNAVYSFKPLLDAVLRLVGEQPLPPSPDEFDIVWNTKKEPRVPQVRTESVPEVRAETVPEVRTKKKSKKNNIKDDYLIEAPAAEIAAAINNSPPVNRFEEEPDPIFEALLKHAPVTCYIYDNLTVSQSEIDEIYMMLINQFPQQLDPEVVSIACDLFFSRACEIISPAGVIMKIEMKNPVGYFKYCYTDAIKQYKARINSRQPRKRKLS